MIRYNGSYCAEPKKVGRQVDNFDRLKPLQNTNYNANCRARIEIVMLPHVAKKKYRKGRTVTFTRYPVMMKTIPWHILW
jgi:hypothetical protein